MHIASLKEVGRANIKENKNLRLVGFAKAGETNLLEGTVLLRMDAKDYEEMVLVEEEIITETEFLERETVKKAEEALEVAKKGNK